MKRKLIALALSAAVVTAMPALSPRQNDMAYAADHTAVPISAAAAYAAVVTETSSSAENAQDPQQETAPTVIAIAGKTYTNSKNGKVELKARLKEADIEAALRAAADAAASQDEAAVQPLRFYIGASAEAKADKAVITISKTLLKKIRKQTKAPLEISTYPSSVTLDRKLMNSLISKAKGTTVDVVTEKSVLSAEQKRLFGKTAIVRKISFRSGGKTILNPNSSGASVVLDLADLPDALQTGEIGIGRVVTGGKVYQNKFSSEKTEKNGSPETKGGRKTGSFRKAGCKKRAEKKGGFQGGHLICHVKTRFPEKAKERPDLGGLSSGGKNRKRNRLYHRRTVREDPGD